MVINSDALKAQIKNYKLNKDTAAEYHVQLFTLHPNFAKYYGADDIDPESLHKSQKFIMQGMSELQYFFRLVNSYGNAGEWRSALSNFKEHYNDCEIPLAKFNEVADALIAAMNKNAGGCTPEVKQSWTELVNKGMEDMRTFGWV
uniref:GLOBIN domain-containing protein n=1 Tax=Rhabditophanes sp. KR3021 TaxID=114890 RepID=A0AC35U6Y2_9BILA